MKEAIITTVVVAIALAAIVAATLVGMNRSEINECMKWSQEADAYPGYFLASWQKDQCDARGVIINAPVK